jgi:hypothetical protein
MRMTSAVGGKDAVEGAGELAGASPAVSVDVDGAVVEGVRIVVGEEFRDEFGSAVDTDLVEHRFDVVADGMRGQEQLGSNIRSRRTAGDRLDYVTFS